MDRDAHAVIEAIRRDQALTHGLDLLPLPRVPPIEELPETCCDAINVRNLTHKARVLMPRKLKCPPAQAG